MNRNKTALVLGGKTGLLGRPLVAALKGAGFSVKATAGHEDMALYQSTDALTEYVDRIEPDYIFNTIAYTQVDKAEDEPEAAGFLNASFPGMLGRIVKTRPIHLVHYSTDFVFQGNKNVPYKPDDPTGPLSIYGKTKLSGEQALLEQALNACSIIRSAWLFGPGKKNFITTILGLCRKNGTVRVVDDQTGSPTYTVDLAQYSVKLVEFGATGLFHIANGGQASWCEFATEAVRCAQVECSVTPIASAEYPQKATRPAYSVLDASNFTRVTGITPRPWPQALREYLLLEESHQEIQ